ncbi:MAG: tRNA pseudouridine(55) synthase TruB [Deltaproteobacteria bacterium]|nr:tRNA pseudouridine(55) synthase TruB [Deltaproteobacteria bacterium]
MRGPLVSAVLLVDKPAGWTSHDVVGRVRRLVGQREVGHTGTLDPMATGLLVITLGAATRIGRFLEAEDKTYEATLRLGRSTDTEDADGRTTEARDVPDLSIEDVRAAAARFVGEIEQRVPAYSAVRVDGERLHRKARRGEDVERPVRKIFVRSLEINSLTREGSEVSVELACEVAKGTYVRTLGVDLAAALLLPGHLTALRRTSVGPFAVSAAVKLEEIAREGDSVRGAISTFDALGHLPAISVDGEALAYVAHGRPLRPDQLHVLRGPFRSGDPLVVAHGRQVVAVAFAERSSDDLDAAASGELDRGLAYACVLIPPPPTEHR